MHIGLLEDDISIQEMLLLVLQEEGYIVTNYPDAEQCIEALQRAADTTPVDLMIIDWRLSGSINGTEVIQKIRTIPHLHNLPIILTTAATFSDMKTLQSLHIALLEKPFAVDDMIALVKHLTDSQSSDTL